MTTNFSGSKYNLMKKWENIEKANLKNIVKYNLLGLFVFHVTILWLTNFRQRDLGAITKHMQTKKVSEPPFLHQIKSCCWCFIYEITAYHH
jgi:hypothetical protein